MKKSTGKKVRFELLAEPGAKVFVAGTFNGWDSSQSPMKENPNSGRYVAEVKVPPGRHEYKFVINDNWQVDPNCSEWVPNGCGSLNSVISVPA